MKVKILTVTGENNPKTTETFEKKLNEALEDGWELSGDMQMSTNLELSTGVTFRITYSQRLTKD